VSGGVRDPHLLRAHDGWSLATCSPLCQVRTASAVKAPQPIR
jgi:hypothetical protein